jgi:DNA-directed RNA polymerase specialized sigma24 family protein
MEQENADIEKKDLTAALFEGLLRRFDPDRERAGEKYENLRTRLIKFFLWNECFPEEDLADETLDRVARKIALVEVHDVGAFLWGVAKNVAREAARRPPMNVLDDLPLSRQPHTGHAELPIIDRAENERRLECLHQCIQKLPASDRELFLEYEYFRGKGEKTQALASRLELTISALQSKAHRLKNKVEKCTLRCFRLATTLRWPAAPGGEAHHG